MLFFETYPNCPLQFNVKYAEFSPDYLKGAHPTGLNYCDGSQRFLAYFRARLGSRPHNRFGASLFNVAGQYFERWGRPVEVFMQLMPGSLSLMELVPNWLQWGWSDHKISPVYPPVLLVLVISSTIAAPGSLPVQHRLMAEQLEANYSIMAANARYRDFSVRERCRES